jgi:hypothetical protein
MLERKTAWQVVGMIAEMASLVMPEDTERYLLKVLRKKDDIGEEYEEAFVEDEYVYTLQELLDSTRGGSTYCRFKDDRTLYTSALDRFDNWRDPILNKQEIEEIHVVFAKRNLDQIRDLLWRRDVNLIPSWVRCAICDAYSNGEIMAGSGYFDGTGIDHTIDWLRKGGGRDTPGLYFYDAQQQDIFFAMVVKELMDQHKNELQQS